MEGDREGTQLEDARHRILALGAERADVDAAEQFARAIAREEIASLCGLLLGRIAQAERDSDGALRDDPHEYVVGAIAGGVAEALHDFGATQAEPGPEESSG